MDASLETVAVALRRLCCVAALALGGCATLPGDVARQPSYAIAAPASSVLARLAAQGAPGPDSSGFRLLPTGASAYAARIGLIQNAQVALDVQYYELSDDHVGDAIMRSLRDAAARGVRVRLLIDDLYTSGEDELLLALAAQPNIEVRLFNPFPGGRVGFVARYAASLLDFRRVNGRMHNKMMIADGAIGIAGGRNLADDYFASDAHANFIDLDTLVTGRVVTQMQSIFDLYWNSPRVYPVQAIAHTDKTAQALRAEFDRRMEQSEPPAAATAPAGIAGYDTVASDFVGGNLNLTFGHAEAYADPPDKVVAADPTDDTHSVRARFAEAVRHAQFDVEATTPYLLPGSDGLRTIGRLHERGVRFSVVTNSLASTDEPLVYVSYRRYRTDMLKAGVELYELSPDQIKTRVGRGLFSTTTGRLHAKTTVIDRELVFIGSMNLDPRSHEHNTELGLFIHSDRLATQLLQIYDLLKQGSTYQARLQPDGTLGWTRTARDGGPEATLSDEPELDAWKNLYMHVLAAFVPEDML